MTKPAPFLPLPQPPTRAASRVPGPPGCRCRRRRGAAVGTPSWQSWGERTPRSGGDPRSTSGPYDGPGELSDEAVAAYVAKYATKFSEALERSLDRTWWIVGERLGPARPSTWRPGAFAPVPRRCSLSRSSGAWSRNSAPSRPVLERHRRPDAGVGHGVGAAFIIHLHRSSAGLRPAVLRPAPSGRRPRPPAEPALSYRPTSPGLSTTHATPRQSMSLSGALLQNERRLQ
jgi:hypothetical protein